MNTISQCEMLTEDLRIAYDAVVRDCKGNVVEARAVVTYTRKACETTRHTLLHSFLHSWIMAGMLHEYPVLSMLLP